MGLILDDASIGVRIGPSWDGTEATFAGSATEFNARVRQLRTTDNLQKTNVRGAGIKRNKNRYHGGEGMLTLSGVVAATGFAFKALGAVSPIGKWIEITVLPESNLETPEVYIGVITRWDYNSSMGEAQLEEIEVDLDPDFVPAP